jgi:hypothetical protein
METVELHESQTGCWLDSHRGHYITRDAIELATGWGFIIDGFASWALWSYAEHWHEEGYPAEELTSLCDDAVAWLNSGQSECPDCGGTGKGAVTDDNSWLDKDGSYRCRTCTGTGRGDRVQGQNFPPKVPEGYVWEFNDGDFGLYKYDEEGELA